ncbi:unnamed protein product [Clonostachys solani]|uniref:Uncharacterized protein n=1 Tax=Clonostachys solani TaxID=160281 RepID=A0A9P0EK05_9HYPO|nr:unnamed protein product [Clonostachys solani]
MPKGLSGTVMLRERCWIRLGPKAQDRPDQWRTYTSFGDDGVTGSAHPHGNLMQISRYFGEDSKEPSGFFCAECYEDAPANPYDAPERLRAMSSVAERADTGSFLKFQVGDVQEGPVKMPKVTFVSHRWPTFEHRTFNFPLSIQYVVI